MLRTRVRVGPVAGLVLSIVFAALFTAIGVFDLFVVSYAPEYGQATQTSLRVPFSARMVTETGGKMTSVEYRYERVIIPRGTVLDVDNEQHRAAVTHHALRRPPRLARIVSAFVLYLFGGLVLTGYFRRFGHSRTRLMRSQLGLFALMVMALAGAKALTLYTALPAFWVPVTVLALWTTVGFDRRTALLVDLAVSFMVASLLRFDLLLLAVFVVRGLTATLTFVNRKQPRQMLLAGISGGVAGAIAYAALTILFGGELDVVHDLSRGLQSNLLAAAGGSVVAGILATTLRGPAQLLLGHVSRDRLLDLTDIEAPLLQKMANEAPGSWEHSRAMANLAEAASASIGADALLTRVGAYYHDLGKTVQPKYFIENLGGERSPHDDLAPEVSADAIMAHVVLGTKILREGGVPEPVVEFAYTHHGTQLVEYFWNQYSEKEPVEGEPRLDRGAFRYPGMKPMTKETAILMIVDSIEAASRTIQPPSHDKFEEMIRRVVFSKLKSGQLDESGLTITDLRIMAQRMAGTLVNMYHGRIKYPWQREQEAEEAREKAQMVADLAAKEDELAAKEDELAAKEDELAAKEQHAKAEAGGDESTQDEPDKGEPDKGEPDKDGPDKDGPDKDDPAPARPAGDHDK